jgi:alkyl sulfatase BDS1-like metallo-beta-lactamase superfamily hydrolase
MFALAGATFLLATVTAIRATAQTQPKPATEATKAANRAVQQYLNFNDREDFENATRGLIGKPDTLTIKNAQGQVV